MLTGYKCFTSRSSEGIIFTNGTNSGTGLQRFQMLEVSRGGVFRNSTSNGVYKVLEPMDTVLKIPVLIEVCSIRS